MEIDNSARSLADPPVIQLQGNAPDVSTHTTQSDPPTSSPSHNNSSASASSLAGNLSFGEPRESAPTSSLDGRRRRLRAQPRRQERAREFQRLRAQRKTVSDNSDDDDVQMVAAGKRRRKGVETGRAFKRTRSSSPSSSSDRESAPYEGRATHLAAAAATRIEIAGKVPMSHMQELEENMETVVIGSHPAKGRDQGQDGSENERVGESESEDGEDQDCMDLNVDVTLRAASPTPSDATIRALSQSSITLEEKMDVDDASVEEVGMHPHSTSPPNASSSSSPPSARSHLATTRPQAAHMAEPPTYEPPALKRLSDLVITFETLAIQYNKLQGRIHTGKVQGVPVIYGSNIRPWEFGEALAACVGFKDALIIGRWTDGEALFMCLDNADKLLVFPACALSLFYRLSTSPTFYNTYSVSLGDTLTDMQIDALRSASQFQAVVLRIIITGANNAAIFKLKKVLLRVPNLDKIVFASSVTCSDWEVVSSAQRPTLAIRDVVHFLKHAVEFSGRPLLEFEHLKLDGLTDYADILSDIARRVRIT